MDSRATTAHRRRSLTPWLGAWKGVDAILAQRLHVTISNRLHFVERDTLKRRRHGTALERRLGADVYRSETVCMAAQSACSMHTAGAVRPQDRVKQRWEATYGCRLAADRVVARELTVDVFVSRFCFGPKFNQRLLPPPAGGGWRKEHKTVGCGDTLGARSPLGSWRAKVCCTEDEAGTGRALVQLER